MRDAEIVEKIGVAEVTGRLAGTRIGNQAISHETELLMPHEKLHSMSIVEVQPLKQLI